MHPVVTSGDGEEASQHALKSMYEVLKHERGARKALEQQVKTLQHDISDLHALVNKLIASASARSPSYPTPSPDALMASTEDRHLTPRAMRSESFAHEQGRSDARVSAISKFSRSETESESGYEEDDGVEERSTKGSSDNVASPDIWATPKEEGFSGSGFFHHPRSREDLKGCV